MWAFMIGNMLIESAWIFAFVSMVYLDHPVWAGFCLVGAFMGGYGYDKSKGKD